MLTLKEIYDIEIQQEKRVLDKYQNSNLSHLSLVLGSTNKNFALYSFFERHNIQKLKQYFYVCGLLDAFRIKNYQSRMFDYDIPAVCYVLLCDNVPFLKEVYANLTYNTFYISEETGEKTPLNMDTMVEDGESAIFVHTIQQFLKGNTALIERNLKIMEEKYLPFHSQNPELMCYDVEFFKALYAKDKSACEEILKTMVSPKIHNKRNVDALLKKYVSMPALGYAKLAWICGVEVDVKSKLIPKELLPIQPNERYDIPYDFLK